MRPNNNRKHYNNKNNNNRYRNNNRGKHGGHQHQGDDEFVSPQQKRHASNQQGKYLDLAKNARQSGDRVEAEYYLQHADHYTRIINLADEQHQEREDAKAKQAVEKQEQKTADEQPEEDAAEQADTSADDAPKPVRKRLPRKPRASLADKDDVTADDESVTSDATEEAPKPKRRGRPPKAKVEDSGASLQAVLPIAKPSEA